MDEGLAASQGTARLSGHSAGRPRMAGEKTKRRGGEAERSPRRGKLNMTDDPLEKLRGLFCGYCMGTGYMELVMADLSREPWPCLYCEAGRRVRDERDGRESNADSPDGAD